MSATELKTGAAQAPKVVESTEPAKRPVKLNGFGMTRPLDTVQAEPTPRLK